MIEKIETGTVKFVYLLAYIHIFCIFLCTHIGLHLFYRSIKRIGHLPRRHDREIDSQQYPDDHEQLVIFYHLNHGTGSLTLNAKVRPRVLATIVSELPSY